MCNNPETTCTWTENVESFSRCVSYYRNGANTVYDWPVLYGPAVIGARCCGVPACTPVSVCTFFCTVTYLLVWQS